jgi:putative ABC transport system permease protein
MLATDVFRLATRMFRTNRSRTILTILGISVGIGAILFLVSLGYGLQQMILGQITTSDALLSLDVTAGSLTNFELDKDRLEEIRSIPGVVELSPQTTMQVQINMDEISTEVSGYFVDANFFRLDGTMIGRGDFYSENEKNKIIISSSVLQLLGISEEEAFEKKYRLNAFLPEEDENGLRTLVEFDEDFYLAGIINEEGGNYIYLPLSLSQELDVYNYSKAKVKIESDQMMEAVRTAIVDKGFMVSALSDLIEQANQVFKVIQIILASFGIVALIVSAIGMFNTMTIALLERTQEIGVMKALGATGIDIWNMFLAESVIIGFFGGLGGIIIGIFGGEVFNYGINFLAGALGGEKIDIFYTPYWFIILIITFSTFVGFLTGFYPAQRAAKINALVALRYK